MAANSKKQEPCSSGSSLQCPQLENLEKWTVKALQKYLRVRGLTYSGMRKAELTAKYVINFLNTINNDNNEHDQSAESHGEWLVLWRG